MKILFDQGVPINLRDYLKSHTVDSAFRKGWSAFTDGALLARAASHGYDLFVTTDQCLSRQQDVERSGLAIVVLRQTRWEVIEPEVADVLAAISSARPGKCIEVLGSRPRRRRARILFDHDVPLPLRNHLAPHRVDTVYERNWASRARHALVDRARRHGYELLVTADRSLRRPRVSEWRYPGILILRETTWERIRPRVGEVLAAVARARPGECIEVLGPRGTRQRL